jgi:hypothetical protein
MARGLAKDVGARSAHLKHSRRLLLSRAGVGLLLPIMPLKSRALLQIDEGQSVSKKLLAIQEKKDEGP